MEWFWIQADIKAITYFKGYAMTAITAVMFQNTLGVQHIYPLPLDVIKDQITSVLDDLDPDVIKIGMMADVKLLQYLKDIIFDKKLFWILLWLQLLEMFWYLLKW